MEVGSLTDGTKAKEGLIKNLKALTDAWKADKTFPGVKAPKLQGWVDNSPATIKMVQFYDQWSNYLSATPAFLHTLNIFPASLMKLFYSISYGLESFISKILILFGMFDYLNDTDTWLGKFYFWGRFLGVAIFVVLLISRIVMSWMGNSFRYKEFFNNLILISFALAVLPTALVGAGNIVSSATTTLMTNGSGTNTSLSLSPIKGNTVDLFYLAEESFDVESLQFDENTKYVGKDSTNLNGITDQNVYSTKFEDYIGAPTEEMLNYYIYSDAAKKTKRTEKDKYYGIATILSSQKLSGEKIGGKNRYVVAGIEITKVFMAKVSAFTPVYARYTINYLAVYLQQICLIMLFVGLILNLIMTIFRILLSSAVSSFIAYTSVEDSTKFMETLQGIFSGMAGIFFEIAILQYGMWFIQNAKLVQNASKASLFSGMGGFAKTILTVLIYIAVYRATMVGSKAIESWLGISTGVQSGMLTAAGATYGAAKAGKAASKLPSVVAGKRVPKNQADQSMVRRGGLVGAAKKAGGMATKFGRTVAGSSLRGAGRFAGGVRNMAIDSAHGFRAGNLNQAIGGSIGKRVAIGAKNTANRINAGVNKGIEATIKTGKAIAAPVKEGYGTGWKNAEAPKLQKLGNQIKTRKNGFGARTGWTVPKNDLSQYKERIAKAKNRPSQSQTNNTGISFKRNVEPKHSLNDLPKPQGNRSVNNLSESSEGTSVGKDLFNP